MPAEIAIRQLTGLAEALAAEGIAFEEFIHDLPAVESKLDDAFARVDWQDYVCVIERIRSRCGDAMLRHLGSATIKTAGSYLFRANILLGYDDSHEALLAMCQPGGMFQRVVCARQADCPNAQALGTQQSESDLPGAGSRRVSGIGRTAGHAAAGEPIAGGF